MPREWVDTDSHRDQLADAVDLDAYREQFAAAAAGVHGRTDQTERHL